jgi:hypothetical protein
MNLERIERALREGPVDEPRYVPGAFGRAPRVEPLVLTAAVAGALVLGLVIGLGLDVLRSPAPNVGQQPVPDPSVTQQLLAGTWISPPVSEAEFLDFMLEQGHAQADVEAFLDHDPIESTLQWGLDFDGRGNLVIFSVTREGVTDVLSSGPYELLADGRLRWVDLTCVLLADFSVSDDQLAFDELAHENCNADERIAHDAFFNLGSPYASSVR